MYILVCTLDYLKLSENRQNCTLFSRLANATFDYLCSNGPPEPANIRRMSHVLIDAMRDQDMIIGFSELNLKEQNQTCHCA